MPPKPKAVGKKCVAQKAKRNPITDPNPAPAPPDTASGLPSEIEDQFELELCWCIQQLQTSLVSNKLQEKQTQDVNKSLNVLRSRTAPLIKKRQTMRNTLGDYREKMAREEETLNKTASSVKFVRPPSTKKKFVFLRKANGTISKTIKLENNEVK